ncbi:putative prophage phiRv2 integrase [Mycobacterium marinum]|uniref:Putative prophage phiRv2 integrase n=2 Tax=Mycobacterium marinum TaxID=1781 RepID=A0A3E2MVN6_MYCMR|nr:putative prophage phiRv2 integrase [Mycobacterium marinum]
MRKERSAVYGKVARWRVRWVDDSGREQSKVFRLKEAAQAHLDQVTADVVRGEYVNARNSQVTFGVVAKEWLAGKGTRKPKTVAGYESLLDHLVLPRWRGVKLKDITHGDVQRWVSGLSANGSVRMEGRGLSASRVIQAHQCMSAVLKYAIRTDRLAKNVAAGIELPRKAEAERRCLTHGQLWDLAERVGEHKAVTLVMGYCGLRIGEVRALRFKDLRDQTLTVRASVTKVTGKGFIEATTKTHRTRWVPVPQVVWELLPSGDDDALVFPGRDGFLTDFEYRRAFDQAAKDVGVPGLVPHELRHTCASLAIAAGATILAVQRLLGHETASMTLDLYGHLYSDDLTNVANALDTAARALSA